MFDKNALRRTRDGKAEKLNRWMEDSSLWCFVLYANYHQNGQMEQGEMGGAFCARHKDFVEKT